jgi:CelD/BcsL family acetyltransferase involved in cellulose biosynthesis
VKVKPLKITRVQRTSDLEIYRDAWRDLASGVPTRSPEWMLVWWQYYSTPEDELCVLLFHEPGGTLVGLAPLYIQTMGKRITVRLLGSGDASTNHTTWLAAPGWETSVSRKVAQFLLDLMPGWNRLEFEFVDADDLAINATMTYLVENGFLLRRTPRHNCWKIALPATWNDYLKMLSKTHRKRCRKLQSEFLESGRVRVHRVTSDADFDEGFNILLRLHAARWGDANMPLGGFSDRRFLEFHKTVARELMRRNQLLLAWLEYQGKPVAVEYQFIDKRTVYSYQAGMDPAVDDFSPGNLSIMTAIQYAIAQGCDTFDLSRGDQPYKANWRATPTSCHDIRIWPSRISGRLEHMLWGVRTAGVYARKLAGQWLKSRVPPRIVDAGLRMLHFPGGKR